MKNKKESILSITLAICLMVGTIAFLPLKSTANDNSFTTISASGDHSMAIKTDGSLWAWGNNYFGQLGDGTNEDKAIPVKVMDNVVSVLAESGYTMAIKTDGSLWVWGDNRIGHLGDGTTENILKPTKIMDDVASVSSVYNHTAVIKTDGSLWAWGGNDDGQLGDGTNEDKATPVKIMDGVVSVSTEGRYTMAIKTDGSLWGWGDNVSGQLGDGTVTTYDKDYNIIANNNKSAPVKIMDGVASVSISEISYTMAIKTDGSLWTWGVNAWGQLGDGTTVNRPYPVKVMDNVVYVSSGSMNTFALKTDHSLWAWGFNYDGVVGDGTKIDKLKPIKVMDNVASISANGWHTMAIKTDDSLWAWGDNYHGRLGDGTAINRLSPVKIMDGVVSLAAGNNHTIAIKKDGNLWAWGYNLNGQLGDGTTENKSTPIKVMDGVKLPSKTTVLTPPTIPTTNSAVTVMFKSNKLNMTLPIINVNGRTMYPFRECLEAMGAKVEWVAETKTAKGTLGGQTVEFIIDSGEYKINGKLTQTDVDVTPFIKDSRTYIPIRYAAEGLGFTVEWDESTSTITIK